MENNLKHTIMKITLAKLRVGEENFIEGYGEVEPGRLFNFKYFKDDTIGIVINGQVYPECSTAFDFVEAKLPPAKDLYFLIENLVGNVVAYKDYSSDIAKMTDLVTGIERS